MNVDAYLARIGLEHPIQTNREDLERLQRAHLTHVPFENLDVYHRRGVRTDAEWSVPKIVERGRGGWCFELNGAFASLLESLGFTVRRRGARVLLGPTPSSEPDHLTLEVVLDRSYLVDVGFGDSFIVPLPLDTVEPLDGGCGTFRFEFGEGTTTLMAIDGDGPSAQYRFGADTFESAQFDVSSNRLQTQPGLHWTERPFATRLLDGGPDRVTLLEDRIKFRHGGLWTEEPVPPDEWRATLHRWFAMEP